MHPREPRRCLALLGLAALLVLPPFAAEADYPESGSAGDAAAPAKEREPRGSRKRQAAESRKLVVGERTGKALVEAREHIGAERYAEAEASLEKLRHRRLTPYERALVDRIQAYVAWGKEDYDGAIESLEEALADNGLPPVDQADVLFQIAQLQGLQRRWDKVIAALNSWFQTVESPNSLGYYLLALAYYQKEDLDGALEPARKAVEIAEVPQKAWLQLLLAIHLTKKDYAAATPVLVELITRYPDSEKSYWLQLAALFGVQEDRERALAVLELAHRRGLLTEDRELRRLAELSLYLGMPLRAAQILEKGFEAKSIEEDRRSFELLASSWIMAREASKAEQPLARAAEFAKTGDPYVRLAQIHLMQEEWAQASEALRQALAKGDLANPGEVQLLLGITLYNEDRLEEARNWFARAQESGATRGQADTWLVHVDREIQAKRLGAQAGG